MPRDLRWSLSSTLRLRFICLLGRGPGNDSLLDSPTAKSFADFLSDRLLLLRWQCLHRFQCIAEVGAAELVSLTRMAFKAFTLWYIAYKMIMIKIICILYKTLKIF